jgi:hypothetical protein
MTDVTKTAPKIGDRVKTWLGWEGKVIEVKPDGATIPDPVTHRPVKAKPLVVLHPENGVAYFFHYDQVEAI